MSCTSPLYRVDARKPGFLRLPSIFQDRVKNDGVFLSFEEKEYLLNVHHFPSEHIQILPCGQCLTCRLGRAKTWAVRCMHELEYHKHAIFCTFTYNDSFLPMGNYVNLFGEFFDTSLHKKDMQDFFKRYREYERDEHNNVGIKVFYCGEYGELNGRPHYHAIIFGNTPFEDAYLWRVKDDYRYYRSPTLERLWSVSKLCNGQRFYLPIGHVEFTDVTFHTCAYVARYCLKKVTGKPLKNFRDNAELIYPSFSLRVEPFICMSRRPGIGAQYALDHLDSIYEYDQVYYLKEFKAYSSKPPRYYDKLFDVDHHDQLETLKELRVKSALAAKTSIPYVGDEVSYFSSRASLDKEREARRKVVL